MDQALRQLLAELEADTGTEVADAFAKLACGYFAETAGGAGRVSTAHAPADLASRFSEPLPMEGRPLADVLHRLVRRGLVERVG